MIYLRFPTQLTLSYTFSLLIWVKLIISDEYVSYLLWWINLNHTRNSGPSKTQQMIYIHVVFCNEQIKNKNLLYINKVRIPFLNHFSHNRKFWRLLNFSHWVSLLMWEELYHFNNHSGFHIWERNLCNLILLFWKK